MSNARPLPYGPCSLGATYRRRIGGSGLVPRINYVPVHRKPVFLPSDGTPLELPNTDYYRGCISLPIYPTLTDDEVETVIEAVTAVVHE